VAEHERKLLIVEDDPGLQSQMRWCFDAYDVGVVDTREMAIAEIRRNEPPVVILDLGLPPDAEGTTEGVAALDEILSLAPYTKVIVVTGNDDKQNSVKSIGLGAYDFYQKPIDPDLLNLVVQRAFRVYELEEENKLLQRKNGSTMLEGIIGGSDSMGRVCRLVEKVAPTDATAILLGESGTGKELLASAIHNLSERRDGRFVAINCAAIPENLLESELFGHEKGAFTGAVKRTLGKVELADGGTLFLDEIGDLSLPLQGKLLRFLQQRVIERVGGREEISVDVRVVCATHQDLKALIEEDRFREDLYYRISEVAIKIPPLRERDGDALLIARTMLDGLNRKHRRSIRNLSSDAVKAMLAYHWPGNVRELENKLNGAVILSEGKQISAQDLDLEVPDDSITFLNLRAARHEAERRVLRQALAQTAGNLSKASELLGITRPTIYDLMKKHSIASVPEQ
jgi:two-component system NtrC family response regulator